MGYFYADKDVFDSIISGCKTYGKRHPLTFALEAADDIAYRTADIEDAVKKGLLDVATLKMEMEEAVLRASGKRSREQTDMCSKLCGKIDHYRDRAKDIGYKDRELYAVQNWIVRVQGMLLTSAVDSFMANYDAIMDGTYKKELLADSPASLLMDVLGDVAYRYAFCSEPILKLEVAADAIFDFLLERLVKALRYYDTDEWEEHACAVDHKMVGLISSSFMQVYKIHSKDASENEKLYLRLLLATDYVSGMTDSYARRLYRELRGID